MRLLQEEQEPWWREFNAAFWLTLSGAFFGLVVAVLNALLKSRCKNFNCCCGLFKAERNWEDDVIEQEGQPPLVTQPSDVNLQVMDKEQ